MHDIFCAWFQPAIHNWTKRNPGTTPLTSATRQHRTLTSYTGTVQINQHIELFERVAYFPAFSP